MRIQKWRLPKNKWVMSTNGWYSRPRTQMDVIMMRDAISAMTFVPTSAITWNPQQHYFTVQRP